MGVADEVQGSEVAKQLVESMKAKVPLERLKEVLDGTNIGNNSEER